MLRLISLLLIVIGIYIGIQYKEPLLNLLGQDSLNQVEDVINDGKDVLIDKIEQLQG